MFDFQKSLQLQNSATFFLHSLIQILHILSSPPTYKLCVSPFESEIRLQLIGLEADRLHLSCLISSKVNTVMFEKVAC